MAVQILTDSTSYIHKDIQKELGIKIISLNVIRGYESMREIDIDNRSFYSGLNKKEIPSSSQPSVEEMYKMMKAMVEEGDELVCVFLSSKMSGTYANSHLAKDMVLEEYPAGKIEIVDSESNCMQLGFAAIVGARLARAGGKLQEVKVAVEENIRRSRFMFLPDNLEYLIKGGRIGGASGLIGTLLKIIPILTVENGETTVLKKARTKTKAVGVMLDRLIQDGKAYGLKEVCVHHINALEEAKELAATIQEKLNIVPTISDIGPIIGLHVGPGAIGLVYYTEKDMR
ncbi:MAG TPA: DegV family protein [Epulopiscium sp.]|nr:DegV family protein [Candidatus Epulonipiscium sp.]